MALLAAIARTALSASDTTAAGVASDSLRARATASVDTSVSQVVMLGTGTPNADPDRSGPCVAIVAGGKAYLVDSGPGLVRRARPRRTATASRHSRRNGSASCS